MGKRGLTAQDISDCQKRIKEKLRLLGGGGNNTVRPARIRKCDSNGERYNGYSKRRISCPPALPLTRAVARDDTDGGDQELP